MRKTLATIAATAGILAGAIALENVGTAHASISDCHVSASGSQGADAVCYSLTAGGNQYVVAKETCRNTVTLASRTVTGPKATVLATSHAFCAFYEQRIAYWYATVS